MACRVPFEIEKSCAGIDDYRQAQVRFVCAQSNAAEAFQITEETRDQVPPHDIALSIARCGLWEIQVADRRAFISSLIQSLSKALPAKRASNERPGNPPQAGSRHSPSSASGFQCQPSDKTDRNSPPGPQRPPRKAKGRSELWPAQGGMWLSSYTKVRKF